MLKEFSGYRCSLCNATFDINQKLYTCPHDQGNLDLILDTDAVRKKYRPEDITSRSDYSIWRYLPILPVSDPGAEGTPLRMVGWTPNYTPQKLTAQLGLKRLWIKDEGRNPTASFKDRASSVVVARARQIQAEVVVTASTGNAGAALAGMAAACGQRAVIFAPKNAPPAKVAQLLVYGAQVILVDGNYDAAFDLAVEASNEFGWYCRNTGYNPFTLEGKKTAALEIWENVIQKLRPNEERLSVFVSVGDGNIISGIHKGFKDLVALGWLDQMPRIYGVQAEGSAAVSRAFFSGTEKIQPVQAHTLADSISVDLPRDGVRAVRAVSQTGGKYLTVSDADILAGIAELGKVGIFAEPAGATSFAGLRKAVQNGLVTEEDPVLVISTGNGLKDVRAAMQSVQAPPVIEPSMAALKKYLEK